MTLIAPPAPATGNDALARLLDDLRIVVRSQRHIQASADETIVLESGTLGLIYVVSGDIQLSSGARALTGGDALLSSGRQALTVFAPTGANMLVGQLALSPTSSHVKTLLPELAWVSRFDELEPAAAALARNLGLDAPKDCLKRTGDQVICRMMATTLLQSFIRSWSVHGCAPEGWPSRTSDIFLDRVVAAIHDEPGRDWTVEALAAIGAMSRSVFAERFNAVLGRSPANYVTEVRMTQAAQMLDAGHSVADTSRSLGYGSDEGFSRAFRKATGITPSRWREREAVPV